MAYNHKHWLFARWRGIKQATENTSSHDYRWAGARGIKNEFKDFEEFAIYIEDNLGFPPSNQRRLHRIDQTGNYCPGNLMWASGSRVVLDGNATRKIHFNNQTHSLRQWCIIYDMRVNTVRERICRGWSFERAITTPTRNTKNEKQT